MNFEQKLQELLNAAFDEDLSDAGDITTAAIFDKEKRVKAVIKAKESGVLSGAKLIKPAFDYLCENAEFQVACQNGAAYKPCDINVLKSDGDILEKGTIIAEIEGDIHTVLAVERTVLNLLQRLSGVATATNVLSQKIAHTKAAILDTRKTAPALRFLEKEAVVHGGGRNHRFGLFDMILIKDTHVKAAGTADEAVKKARKNAQAANIHAQIEVEVQSLDEFRKAIATNPDRIMLDNMSAADMAAAVKIRDAEKSATSLEASGNVSEKTVAKIAETGVDFISVGAITHSVKALDIHLLIL